VTAAINPPWPSLCGGLVVDRCRPWGGSGGSWRNTQVGNDAFVEAPATTRPATEGCTPGPFEGTCPRSANGLDDMHVVHAGDPRSQLGEEGTVTQLSPHATGPGHLDARPMERHSLEQPPTGTTARRSAPPLHRPAHASSTGRPSCGHLGADREWKARREWSSWNETVQADLALCGGVVYRRKSDWRISLASVVSANAGTSTRSHHLRER